MNKRALLIAYHYPPIRVSSGIQRALAFSRHLSDYGWNSLVLSVHPRAYGHYTSDDQIKDIPNHVVVKRAFALDSAIHLSIKGRYFHWSALPDRWITWCFGGTISGLMMIRKYKPNVIWSTYPIATAHLIGLILHRITRIPWIADFRDSMTEDDYPTDAAQRKVYRWIEAKTVRNCCRAVFTTPGAKQMYAQRYPHIPQSRLVEIQNGYSEQNFVQAEQLLNYPKYQIKKYTGQIVLLHSGILYPSERDPQQFFLAIEKLVHEDRIRSANLKILLRATGHDEYYGKIIQELGIDGIVSLEPMIPYAHALAEMMSVDGLLLLQASNCNHQIPAKLYEYLRARRPILALTDPQGNTAQFLLNSGITTIVSLNQMNEISVMLSRFLEGIEKHNLPLPDEKTIRAHSRNARTKELANLFNQVSTQPLWTESP